MSLAEAASGCKVEAPKFLKRANAGGDSLEAEISKNLQIQNILVTPNFHQGNTSLDVLISVGSHANEWAGLIIDVNYLHSYTSF